MVASTPQNSPPVRRRFGLWLGLGLLAVIVAGAGSVLALLRSEAGSAWLLSKVPGVEIVGVQGALLGDRLQVQRLAWAGPAGQLEIRALRVAEVNLRWLPDSGAWLAIRIDELQAAGVTWRSGKAPSDDTLPTLPASLRLPVEATVKLQVGTLQIDALAPVQRLALTLMAGAGPQRSHRIEELSLGWDRLRASGRLGVGSEAPFAIDGALDLASIDGAPMPWQAQLKTGGNLARIELDAALSASAAPGRPSASVALKSSLTPFERWPLAALSATTDALDLAALSSQLPQTRLSGRATLRSQALDQPMQAELQAQNQLPGRWDEGRLPLRRIELAVAATLSTLDRVAIDRFDLGFGDAKGDAGRWSGRGAWAGHTLSLTTKVERLVPQRLDGRAAAMAIDGPVELSLSGLPSPDPAAAAPRGPISVAVKAALDGRLEAAPQPVHVELQAEAREGAVRIAQLIATAGRASARLKANASLASGAWKVQSEGALVDFDPLPWWSGPAGSAWRRGPHRLNGSWNLDLALPQQAADLPPLEMLQRLTGKGQLKVERALLAGVPVSADVDVAQDGGSRLKARVELAGNRATLEGRANPAGDGRNDRWQLELDAPALKALAPLAALHPAAADWAPKQGQLSARMQASGRWPVMRSEGTLELKALQANQLRLERADASWQAATGSDAPLDVRVDLANLAWGAERVPMLRAGLTGTLRAHQLRASAALPLQPPPALAKSLELATQRGSRLDLRGDGAWTQGAAGSRWAGRLAQLAAGPWDGQAVAADAPPATGWIDARELRAEIDLGADGSFRRLRADAGALRLAGDIRLRWDEVIYDASAAAPVLQLKAEIETFGVAPLLARWQPALGWEGDLRVGAQIEVRAGERFDADIVVQRESGDLRVRDGSNAALALGLTDLRLALNAHDGNWLFTQGLAGKNLGEMGGLLRIQARPQDRWPQPDAPLDGSVLLRVANLSIWGTWVPPGWRLAGSLETSATFDGSMGAPQVTGELRGRDIGVRNLLQGVHVTDGQVRLKLDGERATIEQFTLRGGEGTLTLTGGADLGAAPKARVALTAERFQLLGRIDRRLVTSGRAEMTLDATALDLNGSFKVDQGLFDASRADAPSLDADVVVRRPDSPPPQEEGTPDGQVQRAVRVALDLDLGDALMVRGRGLDTRLAGQLRITAPRGKLAVHGTVRTVSGTYAAYGQKMNIERGEVIFAGPVDSPRLDVLALRAKVDVDVGVAITGTAQIPRVSLYSSPEMSETDKLSWLVLGRAPEELGRADTALLQRAAVALLSGEEAGPTDALIRSLGLDELSVRQTDGEVKDTVVSLGKQISQRWYVGYERGVNATTGTWQLIYRIARRLTVRAQSGEENALDLIWTFRVN